MKTIYIPKGETVCYESLATERVVVKGCLMVSGDIKARFITGGGAIYAGAVFADGIRVDDLDAASVTCQRLIAKRVQTQQLIASESAAVSCCLAASYVETGRLTVTVSEISEVTAEEVINLTPKKRSLFRLLLVSALRSFWLSLSAPASASEAIEAASVSPEDSPRQEAEDARAA